MNYSNFKIAGSRFTLAVSDASAPYHRFALFCHKTVDVFQMQSFGVSCFHGLRSRSKIVSVKFSRPTWKSFGAFLKPGQPKVKRLQFDCATIGRPFVFRNSTNGNQSILVN